MMMSGCEPDLEQRVGATVDGDEHRLVLADVRPQRAQVVPVVVAAHDDERVPAADLDVAAAGARAART